MKISKWIAAVAVACVMTACGSPVENAKAAIEEKNYVEAANCLIEVSVEDYFDMEKEEQQAYDDARNAIEESGDAEAIKILEENDKKIAGEAVGAAADALGL